MFRSYDLWVMSPTRFRCANSLSAGSRRGWGRQKNPPQHDKKRPCAVLGRGTEQQKDKSGGSGYRSRFSTLRRLYATMYNNPPSASFGTRTRTYTLEGCNSTLKLRMRMSFGQRKRKRFHSLRGAGARFSHFKRLNGRVV